MLINWTRPLLILGTSGVIFHFYFIFRLIHVSKQNSPGWDAAIFGITSGAFLFACVQLKGRQAYHAFMG